VALTRMTRDQFSAALDVSIGVVGLAVAIPLLVTWLTHDPRLGWPMLVAIALVVVMSRYPLTIPHRSGDLLIGFETCVLVFLTLTARPLEAFCLWAIGTVIANGSQRKRWRIRLFNIGLTIIGGGIFVLVFVAVHPPVDDEALRLAAVLLGCAVYFAYDLVVTAGSLAVEDGCSLNSLLTWSSIPLGLATFVSINTLGFLAALMWETVPWWTLLLLAVPVGTILVAVRSVSENRLAQQRLMGLLETATHAPDWTDEAHIERSLIVQAERTLRQATASLRDEPAVAPEIGVPIEVPGRPTRHLVVTSLVSSHGFDQHDRAALEALTAVGVSAFNRRRLSDEMTYLARHDALTGLHNRAIFTDRLTQALERRAPRGQVAVLYIDLDGFKEVNDVLGHEAGDKLLTLVAQRINLCLRLGDTAARLGGDEFGILLDDTPSEQEISSIATKVIKSTRVNFNVGGHEIRVTVSIGIGTNTVGADDVGSVLRNADIALYEAKGNGKNRFEVFHPDMGLNVLERVELRAALQQAIDQAQFRVAYQPIVNLHTGAVTAYEALLRWQHPVHGLLEPAMFLSTAIETGLILPIGRHVFDQAFAQAQRWNDGARPEGQVTVHVNLSPRELQSPTVVSDIARALRTTGANPETILIEITESAIIGDTELALEHLSAFKAMGLQIGLDDFGTGYSSLSYLRRFPVDVLKIDRCFIDDLKEPDGAGKLLAAVIQLGHALGIETIAEGVETPAQVTWLRDLGCDSAQGYQFGRPELMTTELPTPEFSHRPE